MTFVCAANAVTTIKHKHEQRCCVFVKCKKGLPLEQDGWNPSLLTIFGFFLTHLAQLPVKAPTKQKSNCYRFSFYYNAETRVGIQSLRSQTVV